MLSNHTDLLDQHEPMVPKGKPYQWYLLVLELMLLGVFVVAILFKLESWEGAHTLFAFDAIALILFYLVIRPLLKHTRSSKEKAIVFVSGMLLSLALFALISAVESYFDTSLLFVTIFIASILTTFYFLFSVIKVKTSPETRPYVGAFARTFLAIILTMSAVGHLAHFMYG